MFTFLRPRFPFVYSQNVLNRTTPYIPKETLLGWVKPLSRTTVDQAAATVGLDNAMLLEFFDLGMKLMAMIGIPMLCIIAPLHLFCGGNAAGEDHMSYLSMGNVEHHSWLYWVHAFVVWGVVLIVQASIYRAQERFLPKRFQWLRDMPEPRCTTLLVENIPEELQSDQKLMEEFQLLYPGKIKCAYVVKKSKHLADLVDQRTAAKETLSDAEARWAQDGNAPSKRPLTWWGKEDIIDTSRAEIQRLQKIITRKESS